MERITSLERRAVEALVGTLEDLLAVLATATHGGDVEWLRPLALLSAEIEYSVLRAPTVDSGALVGERRELVELLTGEMNATAAFARQYALARQASPVASTLHERILAVCRHLGARDSRDARTAA